VRASYPLADELRERRRIFCRPLIEALRQAHQAGVVHSPTPESDAYSVFALVTAATDQHDPQFRDRMAAWAHIVRFAWPAFGLTVSGAGTRRRP
jgi:hypothetical protein